MNRVHPAKVLLVAAVVGLGLSGGLAAAALLPTSSMPGAVSQAWDDTVGRLFQNGPGGKASYFTAAAAYIGITETQLRTELTADKSLADVAVAHGKTRDGLIQALVAAEQQNIAALVDRKGIGAAPRPGPLGPGPLGRGPAARVAGDPLAAAASYLGLSAADLEAKLRAGQTLAQIANATSGKSRDGLVAALIADAKAKIAAAQAAGTITAEQATQLNSRIADDTARFVDRTGFGPFPKRGR